jgi:hypothetical protein
MRSAVASLAWEFWSANRRGWTLVLATIPVCALLYRLLPRPINHSDAAEFFIFLPFVASIILATAFCNFTDPVSKNNVAGFPRHLFTRPMSTRMLVTCVMGFSVFSVVGIYIAWVTLVFAPIGVEVLIRWPATVIATGVVLYQAIVWCLSGFRITRVVILSLAVTFLVGIGVIRFGPTPEIDFLSPRWIEAQLSTVLLGVMALAYLTTLATVSLQRRGSAWGWAAGWKFIERVFDIIPHRAPKLRSADSALTWFEWRRGGLLLPALVGFAAILIVGPAMEISGHGPKATMRAIEFMVLLPIVLAYPIGNGLAKPDLWSMELQLSPFFSTRPITGTQIIAAKMKSAAWSTLATWIALLVVALPWLYATCDLEYVYGIRQMFATVYSPVAFWAIAILALFAAMLLTWSLLIGSIWLGQSGSSSFFYTFVGIALAAYLTVMCAALVWLVDYPAARGERFVGLLSWLPWALAALVTVKAWGTIWAAWKAGQQCLISTPAIMGYSCLWLVATASLVVLACLISPRVTWLRDSLILAALLVVPLARMAAAPLTLASNRHR